MGRLVLIVQDELPVKSAFGFGLVSNELLDALTTPGRGGKDDALIAASTTVKADVFVTADPKLLKEVVKASGSGLIGCEGWDVDEFRAFVYGERGYRL